MNLFVIRCLLWIWATKNRLELLIFKAAFPLYLLGEAVLVLQLVGYLHGFCLRNKHNDKRANYDQQP